MLVYSMESGIPGESVTVDSFICMFTVVDNGPAIIK